MINLLDRMEMTNDNHDLTRFTSSIPENDSKTCKLIIIGLEGVGKTTLLNEACGKKYDTSDGRDGCPIKKDQKGSFRIDGYDREYELIDMLGINYKSPGEWQMTLHQRSHVHGVIFLVSGNNHRDSALGEIPRIHEYCSNLSIPVLFIYRDGLLHFKPSIRIQAEFEEISTNENTEEKINLEKFKRYKNLDIVKRNIAQTFENSKMLHQLLDPITICKHVKDLQDKNQELQKTIEKLKQDLQNDSEKHKKELEEANTSYNNNIRQITEKLEETNKNNCHLQEKLSDISNQSQKSIQDLKITLESLRNDNQRLTLALENISKSKHELETKNTNLSEEKNELLIQYVLLNKEKDQLKVNIDQLKKTEKTLTDKENLLKDKLENIEERIRNTMDSLKVQLNSVVHVTDPENVAKSPIRKKVYDTKERWMWLPGRAYGVIDDYNDFSANTQQVIALLRDSLASMNISNPKST